MEVRAKLKGYYNLRIQEEGSIFTLAKDEEFSDMWMETLDGKAPKGKQGKPLIRPTEDDVKITKDLHMDNSKSATKDADVL